MVKQLRYHPKGNSIFPMNQLSYDLGLTPFPVTVPNKGLYIGIPDQKHDTPGDHCYCEVAAPNI